MEKKIVALAGGVGGAKLCLGLYRYLQEFGKAQNLSIIGNTGDDVEFWGLRVCPDLDTVMYTLSGLYDPVKGWGIEGDSYTTLENLKRYGEDAWFLLGDKDFATHILRNNLFRQGYNITDVTQKLAKALGIEANLLPMANEDVRTLVQTLEAGELSFQEYFVRRRATDTVTGLRFLGAEQAKVTSPVEKAIGDADLIVIAPSNPYLSVYPILAVPGMRTLLQARGVPVVAVTPIIGGEAIKGPAAAIMRSMGESKEASAYAVAKLYQGFATHFVLDEVDKDQAQVIADLGLKVFVSNTIMKTDADKIRLARELLEQNNTVEHR
jgi:LPPG:FO 2-phospho-L-lactate transferase